MSAHSGRRLLPPTLFLPCIVASVALRFFAPGPVLEQSLTGVFGLCLIASGAWVLRNAHRQFTRSRTNVHTFEEPNLLVKDGVFRFSRNPMYLGFLMILCGVASCLSALTSVLPVALFFLLADRWYIPFEEAACLRMFGTDYERYRARVRRWL